MPDASALADSQKPDGGWPYQSGAAWTEPTAYALLALVACGQAASPAVKKGSEWLARNQRPDGGWSPRPTVDQSTWVTALVLLLPGNEVHMRRDAAVKWLYDATGRETSWIQRVRSALLEGRISASGGDGWPWFPDTAAWVTPTSLSLLALRKAARAQGAMQFEQRLKSGREYLLSHTCRDAGWNHGSTKALGYDSDSYPETTGQALLGLHDVPVERLEPSLACAARHLGACQSFEASCWLQLGLAAHGRSIPDRPSLKSHDTVMENALALIVRAAADGRNVFLD